MTPAATRSNLISKAQKHGVTMVRVEAESLTHQFTINQFKEELLHEVEDCRKAIVIDCRRLKGRVSSEFLASLVAVFKCAKERGVRFAIAGLSGPAMECFKLTNLNRTILTYETLDLALDELSTIGPWQRLLKPNRRQPTNPSTRSAEVSKWIELHSTSITYALIGLGLLITLPVAASFLLQDTPANRRGSRFSGVSDQPFESLIKGKVQLESSGKRTNEVGAMVIAWPDGFAPRKKLAYLDVERRAGRRSGWNEMVFVARTNSVGKYTLRAHGFGRDTGMNILVLSGSAQSGSSLETSHLRALEHVFSRPKELLKNRQHDLAYVVIQRGPDLQHNVVLGTQRDSDLH